MIRNGRRGTFPKVVILLLTVFMFVYFIKFGDISTTPDPPKEELSSPVRNILSVHVTKPAQTPPAPEPTASKCERNAAVADIPGFATLPEIHKQFLFYRHCRHFPLLLDPPGKCGRGEDVFLLLVIKSSPQNYERRSVLRATWAQERRHQGAWIRRVFISGTSGSGAEKERLNKLLEYENQDYNDIIQWDFADSFFNLTLKQTLFLDWLERKCPNARFLFNGDDDVFAHTDNMVTYLQSLNDSEGRRHLFTGHLLTTEVPVRWAGSKYYVPVQIQKSNKYEPYCGGGGFMLSAHTASAIHRASRELELHPIDDAFMGMCLFKLGLKPSSHVGVKTLGLGLPEKATRGRLPCYMRELILLHRFLPAEMYAMWKAVNDLRLNCSIAVSG